MSTALSSSVDKVHRLLLLPERCNRRSWEIPLFPCSTLIELWTYASKMALSLSACCEVGKTRSRKTSTRLRCRDERASRPSCKSAVRWTTRDGNGEPIPRGKIRKKRGVKFARSVLGLRADRVRKFVVEYGKTWLIAD